jgi:hypothetical protein
VFLHFINLCRYHGIRYGKQNTVPNGDYFSSIGNSSISTVYFLFSAHGHDTSSRYLKLYHDFYIYDTHNRYWINPPPCVLSCFDPLSRHGAVNVLYHIETYWNNFDHFNVNASSMNFVLLIFRKSDMNTLLLIWGKNSFLVDSFLRSLHLVVVGILPTLRI